MARRFSLLIGILVLCFSNVESYETQKHPTVCLNMIVKDEKDVIERCLASTIPMIDYWVIVDTGSTDGTQGIIKEFMKAQGVPGELHERPWINFGHNRNEALQLAKNKGDYLLFIDADGYFSYEDEFHLGCLTKDCYYINVLFGGLKYGWMQLINNHLDWKWVGVLHEYIDCQAPNRTSGILDHVNTIATTEGARSKDPLKYQRDAELLEAALKDEPDNTRYVFYLAQSYFDAGNYVKAKENYKKRLEMGGWDQENYWCLLRIAIINELLEEPSEVVVESYHKAFASRPSRAEALYHLANYHRRKGDYASGYRVASIAAAIPESNDLLFVQKWMSDYGILLEKSICAYWIGRVEECQKISLDLLNIADLPENFRECIERNLGFANAHLVKEVCLVKKRLDNRR